MPISVEEVGPESVGGERTEPGAKDVTNVGDRTPLLVRKDHESPTSSADDLRSVGVLSRIRAGQYAARGGDGASASFSWLAIRNLVGFWIIGMCNNLPGVVLNTAARDILGHSFFNATEVSEPPTFHNGSESRIGPIVSPGRDCNPSTTGVVLLFTVVPGLLAKIAAPFVPVHVKWKIVVVILLNAVGIVTIFLSENRILVFSGIAVTSVAGGLGEVAYLGYTASFEKEVVGSWASGTGGSGLLGSFMYSGFRSLGMSARISVIVFITVPALMFIAHFVILKEVRSPEDDTEDLLDEDGRRRPRSRRSRDAALDMDMRRRIAVVKLVAVPFMIPLFIVYVGEYFINQGLLELIYFPDAGISHDAQYRWLQVVYQLGVFISRSSTACFTIEHIWLLAILQVVNAFFFSLDAYFWFIPSFYIVVALVLYEGLLGGWTYVNAFYRLRKEVEPEAEKRFALSVTSLADTTGIAVAGLLAIPVHSFLCGLPVPKTAYFLQKTYE